MGKHKNKIEKALDIRIADYEKIKKPGFRKPGSRNKKKTGYA